MMDSMNSMWNSMVQKKVLFLLSCFCFSIVYCTFSIFLMAMISLPRPLPPVGTQGQLCFGCILIFYSMNKFRNITCQSIQNKILICLSETIMVCLFLNITTDKIDLLPHKLLKVLNIYITSYP